MKTTKPKNQNFIFTSQLSFLILSIFYSFSIFACGNSNCTICQDTVQCGSGQICLSEDPHINMCAQQCSLTVWAEGEGYEVPCTTGVGNCPETCRDQNGMIFGHCVPHKGLPEDVGICMIETGDLVCI